MRSICSPFSVGGIAAVAALLAVFAASVPLTAADLVGTLPGSVSVDNKGAANCAIPLSLPPGRQGLQPKLTLTYNSQSSNGVVGIGWAISHGFPQAITRGRTILARDGAVHGVDFSTADRLYLDGKRLIDTSDSPTNATYWTPGTVYRTEVDSFVTITATGSNDYIETFIMEDKAGLKYTFGKYADTSDGFQSAGGETTGAAYSYALKRVEDRSGNYLSFTYASHGEGEHLLAKISYTGNAAATPSAYVSFQYVTRTDAARSYLSGRHLESTKRLFKIEGHISVGTGEGSDKTVAVYELGYDYATDGGHSRLKTISPSWANPQSESYALQSAPATTVGWGTSPGALNAPSAVYAPADVRPLRRQWHGDFNGDGKSDVLFLAGTSYVVATPNADGSWSEYTSAVGDFFSAAPSYWDMKIAAVGDFNGDGKTDLVWFHRHCTVATSQDGLMEGWYVAYSTGSGFTAPEAMSVRSANESNLSDYYSSNNKGSPDAALVVDLDGDGIDELLYQQRILMVVGYAMPFLGPTITVDGAQPLEFWLEQFVGGGSGTIDAIAGITPLSPMRVIRRPTGVATGAFTDSLLPALPLPPMDIKEGGILALQRIDLNGDGRSDLLVTVTEFTADYRAGAWNDLRVLSFLNNGNDTFSFVEQLGTYQMIYGSLDYGGGGFHTFIGDVNGDGLDDWVGFQAIRTSYSNPSSPYLAGSGWSVKLSKGDGHFDSTSYSGVPPELTVDGTSVPTFLQRQGEVSFTEDYIGEGEPVHRLQSVFGYDICGALLLDYNGDGRKDFAWYSPTKGWRCVLAGSTGFATDTPIAMVDASADQTVYIDPNYLDFGWNVLPADTAGTGRESLLLERRNNGSYPTSWPDACIVAVNPIASPRLVAGVTDGLGAQTALAYSPISSDSIYTPGATVTYPIRENRRQMVVSDLYRDNGGNFAGNERQHFSYQYSGNRVDLSGRGSLGFHAFVTLDQQTKLFKYQFLTQSFPMTGLTAREETYRYWEGPGEGAEASVTKAQFRILSSHDNTVVFDEVVKSKDDPTAWGTVWPYISRATEYRWEDSSTAHFMLNLATPSTQPEAIFPRAKQSGEYIRITAESLFDKETAVHTALPDSFTPSDTNAAGANAVTGVTAFSAISGHLPRKITYGNLTTLTTDYGDNYGEKIVTGYHDPVGGLTGLVKDMQTFAWGGGYGTSASPDESPKRTFGYWVNDTVQTPLVKTETVDATGSDLDLTTTYSRDTLGRVYETKIENSATGLRAIGSYSISSVPHKSGSQTDYDFDSKFDLPKTTQNAFLHPTKFDYDPILALPTSVTDANDAQITTQYDALGRAKNVTNVLTGIETTTTYALDGVTVTPPTLDSETYGPPLTLTSVYKITVATTAQPPVTTWFDRLGRPLRTTKSAYAGQTATTDTVYNSLGQIVAVSNPYATGTTNASKLWTKTTYDALGRVRTVTSPNGTVATTTYNGRATTVSVDADMIDDYDPAAQATTTLVDAKGRTMKVWNANNDPGTISNTTGGANTASVEFRLDGFGRMRETILNGDTAHKITASYDALGRQETLSDPDKGTWSYINNALGQVVSQTDANSAVTESTFDHLGRPLTRTTTQSGSGAAVETASWFYYDTAADGGTQRVAQGDKGWIGALAREEHALANAPGYTDPGSAKYFYYDAKGRPEIVLSTLDGKWFYTHTVYDTRSRPSTVRYYWRPAAHEAPGDYPYLWENFGFTYSYDDQSHITQIADTAARVWWLANTDGGYDHLDRPAKIQKGSGHWTVRAYRPSDGVLTSIATGPVAGDTDIQNLGFTFDGLGNLRQRTSGGLTETLGYDSLNRLTSSTAQGDTTYEANGNIATKKSITGEASGDYVYSTTKPHAVTSAFGYTMGYDDNGNLTSRSKAAGVDTWSLKWTGFDKPRWMARTAGSVTNGSEFLYDAHRSRVVHLEFDAMSSDTNAAPSHYLRKKLYAAGAAMEVDYVNTAATGAPVWQQKTVRLYVSAPDGTVGAVEIPSLAQGGTPNAWVYHNDHLGSIESITRYGDTTVRYATAAGSKLGRYSEDAWGQRRDPATWNGEPQTATYDLNVLTPRGFTGHEIIDGLGLVHMNGRIYDPQLGRMLSADLIIQNTASLQSYNRYSYVLNNPLTHTDPSGFAVYSAARDLDGVPVGTHQFTIVVPDDPSKFNNLVDLGGGKLGYTLGAHNVNGRLQFVPNQTADLQAAREWADPKRNTSLFKSDFDTEVKLVPTPNGKNDTSFSAKLTQNAGNYAVNEEAKNIPYPKASTNIVGGAINSNSWQQSLIESAGGKSPSDFSGYDPAHNKRIDPAYFQASAAATQGAQAANNASVVPAQQNQQQPIAPSSSAGAAQQQAGARQSTTGSPTNQPQANATNTAGTATTTTSQASQKWVEETLRKLTGKTP